VDSAQLAVLAGVVAVATGLTKVVEKLVTRIVNGRAGASSGETVVEVLREMRERKVQEERFQERVTERLEQLALLQEKIAMIVDRMERRDEVIARARLFTPAPHGEGS